MLTETLRRQPINMYLLAGADGQYEEAELLAISTKAQEAGLSLDQLHSILNDASQYQQSSSPEKLEDRVRELYDLALIIWSDGGIKDEECKMLAGFVRQYGFAEENINEIVDYLITRAQEGTTIDTILQELTSN